MLLAAHGKRRNDPGMVKSPNPALPKAGGDRLKELRQIVGVNEIWKMRMTNYKLKGFPEASE